MKTSLTPALSFGSTSFNSNVIPIKPAKSDARVVNFTGNDSFVRNTHKPADVSFGSLGGAKAGAAGVMMLLATVFGATSCIDVPDIQTDGMKVYSALPIKEKWHATLDSLGFFEAGNLKSAQEGNSIKYIDERESKNEIVEIIIDETKSTPEKLIGTKTITSKNGVELGAWDIEITPKVGGTGVDIAHSMGGNPGHIRSYEISPGSVRDVGVKDYLNGKIWWILKPAGEKNILATAASNINTKAMLRVL